MSDPWIDRLSEIMTRTGWTKTPGNPAFGIGWKKQGRVEAVFHGGFGKRFLFLISGGMAWEFFQTPPIIKEKIWKQIEAEAAQSSDYFENNRVVRNPDAENLLDVCRMNGDRVFRGTIDEVIQRLQRMKHLGAK